MLGQAFSGRSVATAASYETCPVNVKFAVGKEEFGEGFLQIFRFLRLILFHQFSIFTFFSQKTVWSLRSFQLEKCNLETE